MPATYLAPSLIDQGYTGATGTTPYKPATARDELFRLKKLVFGDSGHDAMPD